MYFRSFIWTDNFTTLVYLVQFVLYCRELNSLKSLYFFHSDSCVGEKFIKFFKYHISLGLKNIRTCFASKIRYFFNANNVFKDLKYNFYRINNSIKILAQIEWEVFILLKYFFWTTFYRSYTLLKYCFLLHNHIIGCCINALNFVWLGLCISCKQRV